MTTIRAALAADAALVAPLFDAYRQFHGQAADPALALRFLEQRLAARDSSVFVALGAGGEALGFAQLYPSFSSVAGGRAQGALRLELATLRDNAAAQALYAAHGWARDASCHHYTLGL